MKVAYDQLINLTRKFNENLANDSPISLQLSLDFVKSINPLNLAVENKEQLAGFFEVYEFFRPLCKIFKLKLL